MMYNVGMRFEVPQFIEVEAKIVGPLTWRQFIYVAGGIGTLVLLYLMAPFIIFVIFGIPVAVMAGSLAFHRVNNRPFSVFLESAFSYLTKSKLYLWKREEMQSIIERTPTIPAIAPNLAHTNKGSISSLSHALETHVPRSDT